MRNAARKLVSTTAALAVACAALFSGTAQAVDRVRWAVPMALMRQMSSGRSAITIGPETAPQWKIVSKPRNTTPSTCAKSVRSQGTPVPRSVAVTA